MTPSDLILIHQQLDALRQRDEDARKAISALCERVSMLEEFSSLHNFAITHCTGGCKPELHRATPFEE